MSTPDQGSTGTSECPNFSQALRTVAAGKQDQRDNSRGGDGRCRVHAHRDFERQGGYQRAFSLIVDAGFELGRFDQFLYGQTLAETQMYLATRSASP